MRQIAARVLWFAVAAVATLQPMAPGAAHAQEQPIRPSAENGWTFDRESGRWEKGYEEFRRDDLTDKQRERADKPSSSGTRKTELERGCVGVTNVLAGFPSEDLDVSDCYLEEAKALERAETKRCPEGQKPQVYAVRYWDSKKDTRRVGADGRYPVDMDELYRARPGYVNYDFGYRQSDGSYVHANHTIPGMKVYISPSKEQFDNGYAGFNTVLYCVRCGTDDHAGEGGTGDQGDQDDQDDQGDQDDQREDDDQDEDDPGDQEDGRI